MLDLAMKGCRAMVLRRMVTLFLFAAKLAFCAEQAQLHVAQGQLTVQSATFSPDGRFLVMSDNHPSVLLWDTDNGRQIRGFGPLPNGVSTLAFSRDGRTLATGGSDGVLHFWDPSTGLEAMHFQAPNTDFTAIQFLPDGKSVLTGGSDGILRIWDLANSREIRRLDAHSGNIYSAALSPDGRSVVIGTDKCVQVWNLATEKVIELPDSNHGRVFSVAFSQDGRLVAAGGDDKVVRVWRSLSSDWHKVRDLPQHAQWVLTVQFSNDGKSLLSADLNDLAVVWDISRGQKIKTFPGGGPALFSPDSKAVLVCGGYTPRLYNLEIGEQIRQFRNHTYDVTSVSFSADGRYLSSSTFERTVVWDIDKGTKLPSLSDSQSGWVFSDRFSPDSRSVVSGGADGIARIWDISTGTLARQFVPKGADLSVTGANSGHDQVMSVAFSRDGRYILTGGFDGARVWDLKNHSEVRHFDGLYYAADFSPDGDFVLAGSYDKSAVLWNVATGKREAILEGHSAGVHAVTFSPIGHFVLTGSEDRTARLWNLDNGLEFQRYVGHTDEVTSVAISPDGKTVLTGSMDGTARLWDLQSGTEKGRLIGHVGAIKSVAFSGNGRLVATGGIDGTTRLWRTDECEHADSVNATEVPFPCSMATIVTFIENDVQEIGWAIIDPDGRYDASDTDSSTDLYWLVGAYDTISLRQLRRNFYTPGLLSRISHAASVPPVKGLSSIAHLPPRVAANIHDDSIHPILEVRLLDVEKAGHGHVTIRINGRPFSPTMVSQNRSESSEILRYDLGDASLVEGNNSIQVTVGSLDNLIESDLAAITISHMVGARGILLKPTTNKAQSEYCKGSFFGIFIGTAEFPFTPSLNLRYSASDAQDLAAAMALAAGSICGKESVRSYILSSNAPNQLTKPTKENIRRAFAKVAHDSTRNDLLFVYLSGHGAAPRNDAHSYFYLTEDARAVDLERPDALRSTTTVSADELVQWLRTPNLPDKQVLIIDTCSAASSQTVLARLSVQEKNAEDDLRKAVDLWNQDTGTYILLGSASYESGYESDRFKHGILTYALLHGLKKGDALIDGDRLDAAHWFESTIPSVERFAKMIGVEQHPVKAIPEAHGGLPLGLLVHSLREQISLPEPFPEVLRLTACYEDNRNDGVLLDPLELGEKIRSELRALTDTSRVGARMQISYNDNNFQEDDSTLTPQVRYQVIGDHLRVGVTLLKNKKLDREAKLELGGTDLENAAKKVAAEIMELANEE